MVAAITDYNQFVAQSSRVTHSLDAGGSLEDALIDLANSKRLLKQQKTTQHHPQQATDIKNSGRKVEVSLKQVVNRHNGFDNTDELVARTLASSKNIQNRMTKDNNTAKTFLGRLAMAMFGGLSLLVPMLIMYPIPQPLAVLLVTSISVLLVAIVLTYFLNNATGKDLFGAAAAYAAVLVVFVGTGSSNSESRSVVTATVAGNGTLNGTIETVLPNQTFSNGAIRGVVAGVIAGILVLATVSLFIWDFLCGGLPGQRRSEIRSEAAEPDA